MEGSREGGREGETERETGERKKEYNKSSTRLSTQQHRVLRLSYSKDFIESSVIVFHDFYTISTLKVSSGLSFPSNMGWIAFL